LNQNKLLELQNISKSYPGVLALDSVSLEVYPGEVHCLIGENGAGKSTLIKILSGAINRDSGNIFVNGNAIEINSPLDSQRLGIGIIYQDFKLIPELSIADNIFLGNEILNEHSPTLNKNKMKLLAEAALHQLGEQYDVNTPIYKLSVAAKQLVEISKAINKDVKILAMDEPTASLTESEIKNLFKIIKKLKNDGVGIIYISHRIEEIFEIGDRVTVLRDGKKIITEEMKNVNRDILIKWMVGRELAQQFPKNVEMRKKENLRLENVRTEKLRNINLSLYEGEVLGLAGLIGSGRTELARIIFGADRIISGNIYLNNKKINLKSPKDAIDNGIALLTEDRNLYGLFTELSVRENISISNLNSLINGVFIDKKKEISDSKAFVESLKIRTPSIETSVENLSGGNRQKVVLARWLYTKSKIVIFDEPTAGIDIGVKYDIYNLIKQLVKDGIGVIVISSELPELIGISNRIAVLCEGEITGILEEHEISQEKILHLATINLN
jgi:ribose transport system ATP-binding protein